MLIYAVTIFVSAFLLFLVQPIIAKQILPWFGGSSAVWTTCVFFFQLLLLAGYAYAHALIRFCTPRQQVIVHAVLLIASLVSLPVIADASWKPAGTEDPGLRLLGLLLATVGLPYFLISTTSPLVQAWYARRFTSPYRLFALSNLASLAALLSYPVLVEPLVTTRVQGIGWSWGYAVFVLVCVATAWYSLGGTAAATHRPSDAERGPSPAFSSRLQWVLLPALASFLLASISNYLTQNLASIPFLWILPLSLYLLTFILCFDGRGWYRRAVFFPLAAALVAGMGWILQDFDLSHNLKLSIPVFAGGLFVLCMLCHGELVEMKPSAGRLTEFYLLISLGGALGSLMVSVVAPRVLPADFEIAIGLTLSALLLAARFAAVHPAVLAAGVGLVGFMGWAAYEHASAISSDTRVMVRNFYSTLRTRDETRGDFTVRKLLHGTINHGEQIISDDRRRMATSYFGPDAGISRALKAVERPNMRVGILGLGAGVFVAYGREGDTYRVYEINPQVVDLAKSEFTFLSGSPAKIEVVIGDGRLALERDPPQAYDLLSIDAFSSDSVPVHLMTKQALELYMRHVRPGGVVVFNVTNRYLSLAPIVRRLAESLNLHVRLVSHEPAAADYDLYSLTDFVIVTADPNVFEHPALKEVAKEIPVEAKHKVWTDDFNNLFSAIK